MSHTSLAGLQGKDLEDRGVAEGSDMVYRILN